MFRLSQLVWRDAASRYWAGLVLVCVPGVYLWREWPPWLIRDALWRLSAGTAALTAFVVALAYGLLSAGPTRQLVASRRLDYWRQMPISRQQWQIFHGVHLWLLHAPGLAALGYVLAPGGLLLSVGLPLLLGATVLGPAAWRLGHPLPELRAWSIRIPIFASRSAALARLLMLALLRRRPAALVGLVFASVTVAGLGWAATSHVLAAGEPPSPAGRGFSAAATSLGAVGVWMAWPLVRRDQWWLDSLGAGPRVQRLASVLVAAGCTTPAALVLVGIVGTLRPVHGLGVVGVIGLTSLWAGPVAWLLDADAVRRREPATRRSGRFVLALILPIPASVWHPAALLLPCGLVWWRALQVAEKAAAARRRFEIEDVQDDHG